MAYEPSTEFDLGPLTWVRGEIDQALDKGLAALAAFAEQPEDATQLKHAQSHIHQAAGAVQIVGLDGAIALLEEVERHLSLLETLPAPSIGPHVEAIGAACRRLTRYLNDLTEGEPPVTLKLYPEYEALARLRGHEGVSPTDLFYPDLSRRPAQRADPAADRSPAALRAQRRAYQQGLLSWLRGDAGGLAMMRQAALGFEQAFAGSVTGAFWWSVGGFLASAAGQGILPSYAVKQLCARIDLQMRRFVEGSTKVADRLRREVLYHVAISEPVDGRVREVQALYGLPAMIPQRVESRQVDVDRIQPLLKRAGEIVALIKDNWLKFTGGRRDALAPIVQGLSELRTLSTGLREPAFTDLIAALDGVAVAANRTGTVPDVLAMEFATGMLLTEDAVSHFSRLSDKFPKQVEAMRRRLDFAQRGVLSLPSADEDLLDDMARRAQERMLLAQVAREIQGNLRHVEKVLDAFFRDAEERGELAGIASYTRQIQGALQMLGLPEASELLSMCQKQIDAYAAGAAANTEDLELLAESLSGLGFYIEAVEQQRPDASRLLTPYLRRRLGLEAEPAPADDHSIETALEARREDLPQLIERFRAAPQDPALRAELASHLQALRHDADLVADAGFAERAGAALAAIENPETPAVELLGSLDGLAPSAGAAAPAPSAETVRLLAAGEDKLDAELGEIFLTEANEVLESIGGHLAECEASPGDREALRSIRRGFHTLKGSGRMVGLLELGEAAYAVEKVLNRWLDDEQPATPGLLDMVRTAQAGFGHWVAELQATGAVHVDDRELMAAIARLEAAHPHAVPAGTAPAEPVAPPVDAEASPTVIETIELPAPPEEAGFELETAFAAEAPLRHLEAAESSAHAPEDLYIGEVRISPSLYKILLEETANHLDALRTEHAIMQFDPHARPTDAMVRAAHTLTGIYRTAGFAPVADTAHALEAALLSLQNHAVRPEVALPVVAGAETALTELVDFVGMRQPFGAAELARAAQAREQLDGLARTGGRPVTDSETLAAQAALAEEPPAQRPESTPSPEPATVEALEAAATAEAVSAIEAAHAAAAAEATASALAAAPPADEHAPTASGAEVPRAAAIEAAGVPAPAEMAVMPASLAAAPVAAAAIAAIPAASIAPAAPPEPAAPAATEGIAESVSPAPERSVADALAAVRDDLDTQLLPIFLEEAHELFPQASALLRNWRREPGNESHALELRRNLHTLKGSARMAGAMRLGELTHLMESRLMVGEHAVTPTAELFDALDTDLDQIAGLLDQLHGGPSAQAAIAPAAAMVEFAPEAQAVVGAAAAPLDAAIPAAEEPGAEQDLTQRAAVRVRSDVIDRLVNETGEVAIARSRIEGELRTLKSNLLELTNSVIRLRGQVREIEIQAETQIQSQMSLAQEAEAFDPLEFDRYTRFQELTRSLAEGVNDVATVQQSLLKNLDDADAALLAQARMSRDIQQQLLAVRTVPFASLSERLYRVLRQTAKELDRKANLEIRGGQTELDRAVLEKLVAPLEHLLRNALDHGIEDRAGRIAAGKPEIGEIAITVRQEGNEIALTLADDGRGLPLDAIRTRALEMGLLGTRTEPTQAQLIEAIFAPGFSTAEEVTQISGRGIGMDVVKSGVTGLGGRIEVATTAGKGTVFTLYLPLTLAVTQAVLVRAGGRIFALPAAMVEQVQQVKAENLINLYVAREVRWQARVYPFFYLPQLLGETQHNPETLRYNPVLLLRSANQFVAVHVDEMLGNQEIVIKNIGAQLARLAGLAGATVLGTGEIVLILNPVQLVARQQVAERVHAVPPPSEAAASEATPVAPSGEAATAPSGQHYVLVVDDSLTVRKITSRLLVREGYEVGTARDGVDALQVLADHTPDVILLDIEMPRMDGFEFAKTVKTDPRLRSIPIIMITSRTAEKHRSRAAEIGVEAYLGKPYQEEELLANIKKAVAGELRTAVTA